MLFILFQYKNLIDDSTLPVERSGAIVASSSSTSNKSEFWVTSTVAPRSGDVQARHRISVAYRVTDPDEAEPIIQFALVGDLAKFEVQCTPGEVAVDRTKFSNLSDGLKFAYLAADSGQNAGVFATSELDPGEIQESLSNKAQEDAVVLTISQSATATGASGTYGLQGNKSCTVSKGDYVNLVPGIVRRSFGTLSTGSVAFAVPGPQTDLFGTSEVKVDGDGQYAVKRARFEPETQPDGIFKWSVRASSERERVIGGYRTNSVPGFSGVLEDPSDRWKRDLAILVLGAFIGWFGGSLIEAVALRLNT